MPQQPSAHRIKSHPFTPFQGQQRSTGSSGRPLKYQSPNKSTWSSNRHSNPQNQNPGTTRQINFATCSSTKQKPTKLVTDIKNETFQLNENSKMIANIPKSKESIEKIVDKLLNLLETRSKGVWSTQIEVEFRRKFKVNLPDNWTEKIKNSKEANNRIKIDSIGDRYVNVLESVHYN